MRKIFDLAPNQLQNHAETEQWSKVENKIRIPGSVFLKSAKISMWNFLDQIDLSQLALSQGSLDNNHIIQYAQKLHSTKGFIVNKELKKTRATTQTKLMNASQ